MIYPHGNDLLAIEVDGRPITAKALLKLPGVEVIQEGDSDLTLTFPVSLFDQVAKIAKPRRKRRLTDEQKQKAAERLKSYQYQSRTSERSRDASCHAKATV